MTLEQGLLTAIVVLLMLACGMLGYGVRLLQDSVKTQRRFVRLWVTIHRPPDALIPEEQLWRSGGASDAAREQETNGWSRLHGAASEHGWA